MCGEAPSAPTLPAFPNLTTQEQQLLGQQGTALNQQGSVVQGLSGQLGQNQNILQMISGLFNSDGTVNQSALQQLQQQTTQSTQTAGAQGQSALSGLGSTNSSLAATNTAYQNALQGNVPQNQQLQFSQNQAFQQMQEQAAQQGIQITGTNFDNAVSNSTSGQKLIQNFQQNANIQNQNYALGYTQQLAGNASQLAGTQSQQANTGLGLSSYATQTPVGNVQSSISNGQSALTPYLQSYQTGLSNLYQPYETQQLGPYQQQMAQQQANYQAASNQFNTSQNQLMGWANLGANLIGSSKTSAYDNGMGGTASSASGLSALF